MIPYCLFAPCLGTIPASRHRLPLWAQLILLPYLLFVSHTVIHGAFQSGENTCFDSYDNWLTVICLEESEPRCIGILYYAIFFTIPMLCYVHVCETKSGGPSVMLRQELCVSVSDVQKHQQWYICFCWELRVHVEIHQKWYLVEKKSNNCSC